MFSTGKVWRFFEHVAVSLFAWKLREVIAGFAVVGVAGCHWLLLVGPSYGAITLKTKDIVWSVSAPIGEPVWRNKQAGILG